MANPSENGSRAFLASEKKKRIVKFSVNKGQFLNEAQPYEIKRTECISWISFPHIHGFDFTLTISGNVG